MVIDELFPRCGISEVIYGQVIATVKSVRVYTTDGSGDYNIFKLFTRRKSVSAYFRGVFRKNYAAQRLAIAENVIAYLRNSVGDNNARQSRASAKSAFRYIFYSFGYIYTFEIIAKFKRVRADAL